MNNSTRMIIHRGHTPDEIFAQRSRQMEWEKESMGVVKNIRNAAEEGKGGNKKADNGSRTRYQNGKNAGNIRVTELLLLITFDYHVIIAFDFHGNWKHLLQGKQDAGIGLHPAFLEIRKVKYTGKENPVQNKRMHPAFRFCC